MNTRDQFKELLYGTTISSISSEAEAIEKNMLLQEWILEHLPKSLYHFSSCSDHAVEHFRNDEIWGSNIREFNDPYECTPRYDLDVLNRELFSAFSPDTFYKKVCSIKNGTIPEELKAVFPEKEADLICSNIAKLSVDKIKTACDSLPQVITNLITNNLQNIVNDFFISILQCESEKYISCFCEENTSTLMWGHYANGHRGFCLEYDFSSIVRPCLRNCQSVLGCNHLLLSHTIAPVIYTKNRFDATSHLMPVIQSELLQNFHLSGQLYHNDTLLVLKCLLTKSEDWSYEKEWRIFSEVPNTETSHFGKICNLKPTALYIGSKTERTKEEELYRLCQQKGIPCYKMILSYHGNDFELTPVLYDKYFCKE